MATKAKLHKMIFVNQDRPGGNLSFCNAVRITVRSLLECMTNITFP